MDMVFHVYNMSISHINIHNIAYILAEKIPPTGEHQTISAPPRLPEL